MFLLPGEGEMDIIYIYIICISIIYIYIQCDDGHFAGDYGGPMFLLPGLVIAAYVTGAPLGPRAAVRSSPTPDGVPRRIERERVTE